MKKIVLKKNVLYIILGVFICLFFLFGILKQGTIAFLFASLSMNLFFIIILEYIYQTGKIKLNSKELTILLICIVTTYGFYTYSILDSNFIYYWDFSCYYNIQIGTIEAFQESLFNGIKYFIGSTYSGEYGNFLSFFPQIIFHFTNKSINSYTLSCVYLFVPYIWISFSFFIKKLLSYFKVDGKNILEIILVLFTLMPVVHGTFIYGQPDILGIAFIFCIISMTIDYDFKKLEWNRLFFIFATTFMLIISRRWYLYWIVTYYACYVINILWNNKKDWKKIIRNLLIYGALVIVLLGITLAPLMKNILMSRYASTYSYYSNGGFFYEWKQQMKHVGYLPYLFMVGGFLFGILQKKYRKRSLIVITQYIIMLYLFTRVQTMGIHHSLILISTYIFFYLLFIIAIVQKKSFLKKEYLAIILLVAVANFYAGYQNKTNRLWTDVSLKVPIEENYDEIKEIVDWLTPRLDEENTAYLITHNNSINPDKLRNFYTPNSKIKKYLPYGSAIIGSHKFPLELFTARYIMTTSPYESTSVDEKYNQVFQELVEENVFEMIHIIPLKNNIKLYVYERKKDVTEEEKEKYKKALTEESKKYSELYEQVINSFSVNQK